MMNFKTKKKMINSTINIFEQSIIATTLSNDDLRKLANDYDGKLCGQPRGEKLSIIIGGECTAIYTMNQYLWKKHQLIRYTFTEIQFFKNFNPKPKQR